VFGTDQAATEDEVTTNQDEIAADQAHFDNAWEARERKRANLANAGAAAGGPSKTMAAVKRAGEQHAASLGNPDEAVAFGRFDRDGERYFIGYQLISSDHHDPLVINWKTRAAEPFYKATVQSALGLDRKRSYTTSRNKILDFSDTVFSQLADAVAELSGAEQWGIDDALLNDLESSRTGEMQDIVQTIHASQYDLIQSTLDQLLVIQGGPGTGKTAIALHRISWLLYNHQDRLAPEDCLVIGPNPTFTRYINAVLPGLGDRDVSYRDLRGLGPLKSHGHPEPPATARLKGEARIASLLRNGLWQRVGFPDRTERLTIGAESLGPSFSREEITAEVQRQSERHYNAGRVGFRQYLQIESQKRARAGVEVSTSAVENALERVWPQATPASFLRDFLGSRDRLLAAAENVVPEFTVADIRLLHRPAAEKVSNERWADADVGLLDELDQLINGRPETYMHIVVDEAQDLSPMQLRSVRRRSRTGSMTIVGDIAQSTGHWARDNWAEVAQILTLEEPCHTHELSLGYRVPRQIFEFAAQLLPIAAPDVTPPRVVREGPADPEILLTAAKDLASDAVAAASRHAGNGRFVGLIAPDSLRADVIASFEARGIVWADVRRGELGKSINLASPEESKGLEFDAVVVVDPGAIVKSTERGHRLLYVALTRTTKYLTVVHDGVALPGVVTSAMGQGKQEAIIHTVDEPPTTAEDVTSVQVTSGAAHPDIREAAPNVQVWDQPTPPVESPPTRPVAPKSEPASTHDRLTLIVARDIAADVRASLLPTKYPEFVDALRRELGVGATDLLDHMSD